MSTQQSTKTCTKCESQKPLSAFGKQQGGKYGLNARCKECQATISRQFRKSSAYREAKAKSSTGWVQINLYTLKYLIATRGVPAYYIADEVGVGRETLSALCKGKRRWTQKDTAVKLAKAFGLEMAALLDDPDVDNDKAAIPGLPAMVAFRKCSVCDCTKPLQREFFRWQFDTHCRSGGYFEGRCRSCRNAVARAHGPARRKRSVQYHRDYQRRYTARNPEAARERKKRSHEKISNTEEGRYRRKERKAKRRAAERATGGSLLAADIRDMYESQEGKCAYCEVELGSNYHVDHMIPLARGGSNDAMNVALTCPRCNLSKRAKTVEEFMEYLAAI